jgi:uncharacterized membrane protein (DUF4010 family)
MEPLDLALRLGLALAIGLLIGLERGWRERDEAEGGRTAGLRTFALTGLLGGIMGALSLGGDRLLLAAGFIAAGGALAAFMWREGEHDRDFSATSLVAALLTLALGAFAVLGDVRVAAGAGVAAAILLANKEVLHAWLQRLTWIELRAGLLLAAMTFIALPLLPDRAVDPWDALNPYRLWLLTVLIAAVSFAGYAAVRIAGPQRGLLMAAALGGVFASTAVTLSLARLAPGNVKHVRLLAGGILASGAVMMVRVLAIAGLINFALAETLAPALLAAAATMAVAALVMIRSDRGGLARDGKGFDLKNPFEPAEVLRFGALLAVVSVAAVLARRELGDPGLLGLAALSGLADVDAMTLSVARLGEVSAAATLSVLVAVAVNTFAKAGYAWAAGGTRIGLATLAGSSLALAAGLGALRLSGWP